MSIEEMKVENLPEWLVLLEEEDWQFIHRFILASGSLKEIATQYSVSYPTVRARLDRLISKIQAAEAAANKDAMEQKIKVLVADGKLSVAVGKELLKTYRQSIK